MFQIQCKAGHSIQVFQGLTRQGIKKKAVEVLGDCGSCKEIDQRNCEPKKTIVRELTRWGLTLDGLPELTASGNIS